METKQNKSTAKVEVKEEEIVKVEEVNEVEKDAEVVEAVEVVDTLEEVKEDVLLEKTEKKSEVETLKEKLRTLINEKRELIYPKVVLAKSEVLDILKDITALL